VSDRAMANDLFSAIHEAGLAPVVEVDVSPNAPI
jgi:hypothetical protein